MRSGIFVAAAIASELKRRPCPTKSAKASRNTSAKRGLPAVLGRSRNSAIGVALEPWDDSGGREPTQARGERESMVIHGREMLREISLIRKRFFSWQAPVASLREFRP